MGLAWPGTTPKWGDLTRFGKMCRKSHLEFKPQAFEDLQFWVRTNPKLAKRLLRLIEETVCDPIGGVGKPKPLRGELSGWWSKRIDQEHRLVYQVEGERLIIAQARGHYDD